MERTFRQVETYFSDQIYKHVSRVILEKQNICCEEKEIHDFLLPIALTLKRAFPEMTDKDICITIIYTYYALNLNEQTEDFMNNKIYKNYADNPARVEQLYLEITTQNIMFENRDLSSAIRRYMLLGHNGGKKRKNNKKGKNNKKRKSTKRNNKKSKKGKSVNRKTRKIYQR